MTDFTSSCCRCLPTCSRPTPDGRTDHACRALRGNRCPKLAVNQGLLYRRGNFNGTGDQLLLDTSMDMQNAEIAFSPGFRWGTSLLPGQAITREWRWMSSHHLPVPP